MAKIGCPPSLAPFRSPLEMDLSYKHFLLPRCFKFPRRLYRGTKRAYSGDELTRDLVLRSIESGVCSRPTSYHTHIWHSLG